MCIKDCHSFLAYRKSWSQSRDRKKVLTRIYALFHQMSSAWDKTGKFTNTNYTEITRKQNSYPLVGKAKNYRGADKTRKETSYSDQTITFASHTKTIQKVVHPTRSLQQQWPPRWTKNGELSIVFTFGSG